MSKHWEVHCDQRQYMHGVRENVETTLKECNHGVADFGRICIVICEPVVLLKYM